MRLFISLVTGILLGSLMIMLENFLSGLLGFPTYVDYGGTVFIENFYYDELVDGHSTGLGWFFIYLTFLVAIRGGMAVFYGKINANVSKKNNFILFLIGIGLLTYGVLYQLIYFVFNLNSVFSYVLHIAIVISVGYACYIFYNIKIDKMKKADNN